MFSLGQVRAKESTKYLLYKHEGSALRFCYYLSLTLVSECSEEDFSLRVTDRTFSTQGFFRLLTNRNSNQ